MKLMSIFPKLFILILSIALWNDQLSAQQQTSNDVSVPADEWTVPNHKDQLKLTLIIDSIQVGKKVEKLNFQRTLNLEFETDYLQIKGDIYIKIFISRNQEYGKKFYSWKWDYLKKKGDQYHKLDVGYYAPMYFDQPIPESGSEGQGLGIEGKSDYLMFYYRYKLE
jgi:hypothetical protein